MSKVDLDALEALEAKATPGQWLQGEALGGLVVKVPCHKSPSGYDAYTFEVDSCDGKALCSAQLIVQMRNNIKPMIAELRALRKLADALKKAREEHYCNVPVEVDDALAEYKKLVGEK